MKLKERIPVLLNSTVFPRPQVFSPKAAWLGPSFPKLVGPKIANLGNFILFGLVVKILFSTELPMVQAEELLLKSEGRRDTDEQVAFYLENAKSLTMV